MERFTDTLPEGIPAAAARGAVVDAVRALRGVRVALVRDTSVDDRDRGFCHALIIPPR